MKLLKVKLLVVAALMLVATSAFASFSYDVNVDTTLLAGDTGYLYLQYTTINNAVASTATVSNFVTNGTLAPANDTVDTVNSTFVSGTLPGSVVFANGASVNDYNHAITFGTSLNFLVTVASAPTTGSGVSTFSLGLFADPYGTTPLINLADPNVAGTGVAINLNNNGTTSAQSLDATATATPTPIPAAFWLLGSGLAGLAGRRKKMMA